MIFRANVCHDTVLLNNCISTLVENKDHCSSFKSGCEARLFNDAHLVRSRVFNDNNTWFRFDVLWARSDRKCFKELPNQDPHYSKEIYGILIHINHTLGFIECFQELCLANRFGILNTLLD